jgi:hypothetical protein
MSLSETKFGELGRSIAERVEEFGAVVRKEFEDVVSGLNNEIERLGTEGCRVADLNENLVVENAALRQQLASMEEEHRNFTRVSHVIALQNENAKLVQEKEKMSVQLRSKMPGRDNQTQTDEQVVAVLNPLYVAETNDADTQTQDTGTQDTGTQDTDTQETHKTLEVREKKIGATVYYLDTDNNIHSKEADDSIGKCLGYLTKDKDNKKYRAVWHEVTPGS